MSLSVLQRVMQFSTKYPVTRGIVSYAIIWPVGSIIQQTIAGVETYDYARAARFCIYGSCYVAPTLHVWLRLAVRMFPQKTFLSAVTKAVVEQFTYTPFAMVSFYFGMSLMEGKTVERAKQEVTDKFIPTYKAAVCVWPSVQTINYLFVPERNRLVVISVASLVWTVFMAYMKSIQVALIVWPILQTINHSLIPEKNRVVYVSVCSLLWSTFLSYMKVIELKRAEEQQVQNAR